MLANEVRQKFLEFFKEKGHAIIPSASLIPENDSTTLFTGSGMQPMVPYLLGEKHPFGSRLANSQKSFRTVDIEEVGDNRHTTFFEMLGNWSLGDYFKTEQINWMFEFLVEKLGLDPKKIYVTVFIGDENNNIPKDTEVADLWKKLFTSKSIDAKEVEIGNEENGYKIGMNGGRIFYYDVKKNWWSRAGVPEKMPTGEPGGPDSEMFYEFTEVEHDKKFGEHCHPNCDCGRFIEIGNNVFMQFIKNTDGTFSKLPKHNVDFGGGLERLTMASNNCPDIFEINHKPILNYLESLSNKKYNINDIYTKAFRVIADHMKATVFLICDGVVPSNVDQGYFVRRLIRRSILYVDQLGIKENILSEIVEPVSDMYFKSYPEIKNNISFIRENIDKEEKRFRETLSKGLREFEKGIDPFVLFTTYGFPIELTEELAKEKGREIDLEDFSKKLKEHQELSRTSSAGMFKGGLADAGDATKKLHTATHLLNGALRQVLGNHVMQKGSNINAERLRFDFTHHQKVTEEELKKVEEIVNGKISEGLPIGYVEMPKEEAEKIAVHSFNEKYGDIVKVYSIGDEENGYFSSEFCGGPHVSNTGELGHFKIQKEEAVASGIRRIKAILE